MNDDILGTTAGADGGAAVDAIAAEQLRRVEQAEQGMEKARADSFAFPEQGAWEQDYLQGLATNDTPALSAFVNLKPAAQEKTLAQAYQQARTAAQAAFEESAPQQAAEAREASRAFAGGPPAWPTEPDGEAQQVTVGVAAHRVGGRHGAGNGAPPRAPAGVAGFADDDPFEENPAVQGRSLADVWEPPLGAVEHVPEHSSGGRLAAQGRFEGIGQNLLGDDPVERSLAGHYARRADPMDPRFAGISDEFHSDVASQVARRSIEGASRADLLELGRPFSLVDDVDLPAGSGYASRTGHPLGRQPAGPDFDTRWNHIEMGGAADGDGEGRGGDGLAGAAARLSEAAAKLTGAAERQETAARQGVEAQGDGQGGPRFNTYEEAQKRRRDIETGLRDEYTRAGDFAKIGDAGYNRRLRGMEAEEDLAPAESGYLGRLGKGLGVWGGMNLAYGAMEAVQGVERAYQPALQGSAYLPDQAAEQAWTSFIPLATTVVGAGIGAAFGGAGAVPGAMIGGMVGEPIKQYADDYYGRDYDAEHVGQAVGFGQGGQADVEAFTQALKDATAATKDAGEALGQLALTGPVSPGFVNQYAADQTYLGTATAGDYKEAVRALSSDPMLEPYRAELAQGKLYGAGAQAAAELAFAGGDWSGGTSLQAIAGAGSLKYGGAAQSGMDGLTWEQFNERMRATDKDAGDNLTLYSGEATLSRGNLGISRLVGDGAANLTAQGSALAATDRQAESEIERQIAPLRQLRARFADDPAAARALDTQINSLSAQELPFRADEAQQARAGFDARFGEEGARYSLSETQGVLSGKSAEDLLHQRETQARYLGNVAEDPRNPLSPSERAGIEETRARLDYSARRDVDTERTERLDVGTLRAGLGVAAASASGTAEDVYGAQGRELESFQAKIAELTSELERGGLAVSDRISRERELTQTQQEAVELTASRRRGYYAAEDAGAQSDITAATAPLARQVSLYGSESVDTTGVLQPFSERVGVEQAALAAAPPGSNEWKAARAGLATAQADYYDEQDALDVYHPDAKTRAAGTVLDTNLRHAESRFEQAELAPWQNGDSPLTAGLGVERAIGQDRQFVGAELSQMDRQRQQRIGQGLWDDNAQAAYTTQRAGLVGQEDDLDLRKARMEHDRMMTMFQVLPEVEIGSPGKGVSVYAEGLDAVTARYTPSLREGSWGHPMNQGTHTPDLRAPGTLPATAFDAFQQGTGAGQQIALLTQIASSQERIATLLSQIARAATQTGARGPMNPVGAAQVRANGQAFNSYRPSQ